MVVRTLLDGRPFDAMAREMDRLFESLGTTRTAADTARYPRGWQPPMNVWEDDNCVYAEAELPGLSIDDLELTIDDNVLTLNGRRSEQQVENARPLRRERLVGEFQRSIALPAMVEVDQVQASLNNGVLTVTMPKTSAHRRRRIEISPAQPTA